MKLERKDFKDIPIGESSFYLSHILKSGSEIAIEPSLTGYFIAFYNKEKLLITDKIHIPFFEEYSTGIRRLSTHYTEYFETPKEKVKFNILISIINTILNPPKL